jgi:threonine/homoserine/homoserine lactone efflux protein
MESNPMAGPRQSLVKHTAAKKGVYTGAAAAGTVVLFLLAPWWLGVVGAAGTGYLAYDWLRYRGKWGMRF